MVAATAAGSSQEWDVAGFERYVACRWQSPSRPRRLAGVDEQAVVSAPGDCDRRVVELLAGAELVSVEGGQRAHEGGRRPGVIEGRRGFGCWHARGPAEGLLEHVEAFAGFFTQIGIARSNVAGNSMGGAIALELARRHAATGTTRACRHSHNR